MTPGAPALERLRALWPVPSLAMLTALARGGVVVTTPPRRRPAEPVAFETVIQIDGDVTTSVDEVLLANADAFERALAQHEANLAQSLREVRRLAWLILAARVLAFGGSATTAVVGASGGVTLGVEIVVWLGPSAAFAFAGGLAPRLVRLALGKVARRAGLGRAGVRSLPGRAA